VKTRVVKADGARAPRFDAHIHLMEGSLVMDDCTFDDAQPTLAQIAPIIRNAPEKSGDGWLTVQN
jgi:hypothetical protein